MVQSRTIEPANDKMSDLMTKNDWNIADSVIINALKEDIGNGDITTSSIIPEKNASKASLVAKGNFILAGLPFAERTFSLVGKGLKFKSIKKESSRVKAGDVIAKVEGNTRNLLMAERVALNILQRLSGIATLTGSYIKCVRGLKVKIVDTRKTLPGLRFFEKYAVRTGGGYNHRYGLFDGVLIKDNHITAVGGLSKAVRLARLKSHHLLKIEVEVKNLTGVEEAISSGADIIMLDNMHVDMMKKAVNLIRSRNPDIIIEASGNINLENVRTIAETGVDLLSVGALTHSAPAVDISLMFD